MDTEFEREGLSTHEWIGFFQSEAAYAAEKSRNPFFKPHQRKELQAVSAAYYAQSRKHMGVECP